MESRDSLRRAHPQITARLLENAGDCVTRKTLAMRVHPALAARRVVSVKPILGPRPDFAGGGHEHRVADDLRHVLVRYKLAADRVEMQQSRNAVDPEGAVLVFCQPHVERGPE